MTKIFKHSPIKLSFIIYHLSFSLALCLMFTGCGLYQKYEKTVQDPDNAFGTTQDITSATSETTIADLSWREFFTDPLLQNLIEQALANNTDLNTARINVEKFRRRQGYEELHPAAGYLLGNRRVRFHEE